MDSTEALEQSQPGLVRRVTKAIRKHHLNYRAEQTYLHWISRFVLFHDLKNPETLQPGDRQAFLAHLSDRMEVSRARLNQAKQALAFFYEDVLGKIETGSAAAA
ncbi:site-specific integrase [Marinobacter orientalis]|uniref:Integrase n=1 Tax=Marinobacter orientalis TaxID=1928859 RepID=A0A7Y0NJF9_9GAMM|nr:site-specific integrase [Marinobacter orientalis]NMT62570.1 integrase [Marinobacter orientalis]TGX51263.1 integrase [Marinobacter orientalis]